MLLGSQVSHLPSANINSIYLISLHMHLLLIFDLPFICLLQLFITSPLSGSDCQDQIRLSIDWSLDPQIFQHFFLHLISFQIDLMVS